MAQAIIRPDSQRDIYGTWFVWPDNYSHLQTVNDNWDGSFTDLPVSWGTSGYIHFDMQNVSLPAGSVVRSVRGHARIGAIWSGTGGTLQQKTFEYRVYHGNWNQIACIDNTGNCTYNYSSYVPLTVSTALANISLTQSEVNDIWVAISGWYLWGQYDSGDYVRFYDVWVEVNYDLAPVAPTSLTRTGNTYDSTPNFSAVALEPNGYTAKVRFEIYQNNETTLVGTVDSGFVAANTTATAEYTTLLPVGTYKLRAKTISSSGMESGYTSWTSFTVTPLAILGGAGGLTATGTVVYAGAATLTGTGGLTAHAEQPLCLFPYLAYTYGGVFLCVENIGSNDPLFNPVSNVRDLCIVRC